MVRVWFCARESTGRGAGHHETDALVASGVIDDGRSVGGVVLSVGGVVLVSGGVDVWTGIYQSACWSSMTMRRVPASDDGSATYAARSGLNSASRLGLSARLASISVTSSSTTGDRAATLPPIPRHTSASMIVHIA